jgi:hypothetical protein
VNYSGAAPRIPEGGKFGVGFPGAPDTVRWHTLVMMVVLAMMKMIYFLECSIFGGTSRMYLLLLAVLCHETFVADVGEEEAFVDGDVGGVLVGGGVGGALVEVSFPTYVCITALLLVVSLLLLLLPFLVFVPVTFTRNWTFSYKMIRLTTTVTHPLGAGLVVFPPPLFEDLVEALDDECHLLIVELGGIDWKPTRCRLLLLFFRCFECNGLHLRCGGGALLQVYNVFGVFDH